MNENSYPSVLNYYKSMNFNPVPISIDSKEELVIHQKKRINLLQNHLSIPILSLKDKEVIEFGCNSGENALILAALGARLTLVEPNEQVIHRLMSIFKSRNLEKQIVELAITEIEDYQAKQSFDLVIAEGFLNTMPNRDILLESLFRMCNRGGGVIINYDDRYGGLFELLKSCILRNICYMKDVDFRCDESFELAEKLFLNSFEKLNVSRPFRAWWEDQLVNQFCSCIWSLEEILNIADKNDYCCFSTSPILLNPDLFKWYKDIKDDTPRNVRMMSTWRESFAYILSGKQDDWRSFQPASEKVVKAVFNMTEAMASFLADDKARKFEFQYPVELGEFFKEQKSDYFDLLDKTLERFFKVLNEAAPNDIIEQYINSNVLQGTYGTALHYVHLIQN